MSIDVFDGLWASRDCAAVVNNLTDEHSPPTEPFEVRQGGQLAMSIIRLSKGEPASPFSYRSVSRTTTVGFEFVIHARSLTLIYTAIAGTPKSHECR